MICNNCGGEYYHSYSDSSGISWVVCYPCFKRLYWVITFQIMTPHLVKPKKVLKRQRLNKIVS